MSQSIDELTVVRIAEWSEWIELDSEVIAVLSDPQTGRIKEQRVGYCNGYTGFPTKKNERLVDIKTEVPGVVRTVDTVDDEGNKSTSEYRLFMFRAVLARNGSEQEFKNKVGKQRKVIADEIEKEKNQLSNGRDKRGDLVIVENKVKPSDT